MTTEAAPAPDVEAVAEGMNKVSLTPPEAAGAEVELKADSSEQPTVQDGSPVIRLFIGDVSQSTTEVSSDLFPVPRVRGMRRLGSVHDGFKSNLTHIPSLAQQESLRTHFEKWGPVEKVTVRHPQPRPGASFERTRSFGFVSVVGEVLAQQIMQSTHIIDGKQVSTEIAKPVRHERPTSERASRRSGPHGRNEQGGGWSSHQHPSSCF